MDTKDIENEGDKANKCTDIKESGKMTEPSDKTTEKFLTTYKNNGDEYIGPNGANVNFDKSVHSKTSSKAKTRNKNKFLRRSKSCQDMSTSKHKTIPHSNSFCAKPFNSSNRQASIPEIDGDEKFEAPHNNQSPVANESSSSAASIKSTDCEAYVPKKVPTFILNDLDSEEEPFSREKSDTENPSVSSASKNVNYVSSAQLSLTQSSQSSMESPILPIKSSSSSSSLDSSTPPTLQSVQTSVSLPVAVISPTPTPSSPCPMKEMKKDFILLHTDADLEEAQKCRDHLKNDIGIRDLTVDVSSEIDRGRTAMISSETLHGRYNYILVFTTENLRDDKLLRFVNENILTKGLKDANGKEHRIIPIWRSSHCKDIIFEFLSLYGFKYYEFLSDPSSFAAKSYTECVKNTILEGRTKN